MASIDSPKALGEHVGKVCRTVAAGIEASLTTELVNGDGLSYITPDGETGGFRANRISGNTIYPAERISLPPGTRLYRSFDRNREEALSRPTATRLIPIDLTICRRGSGTIVLAASVNGIGSVETATELPRQEAKNDPVEHRRRQLSKWGDTIFSVERYDDLIADEFIPASQLADMRRRLAAALSATLSARREISRPSDHRSRSLPPAGKHLSHRDNVSNNLARQFYRSCGVTDIEPAIEIKKLSGSAPLTLMETRYCLRRQLGACLMESGGDRLAEPLTLHGQGFSIRLSFDCKNCKMRVNYLGK